MDPQAQEKHHTSLFIILGICVIGGLYFWWTQYSGQPETPSDSLTERVTLTPAERKAKEEFYADPALSEKVQLTPAEADAKRKAMEELYKVNQ